MDDRAELSEFLKSRRARLRLEDVGLRDYGGTRRVAGLRREELARVAGVSIAHYTRLEQGHSGSVSSEVLDAVGTALRLDADELDYLHLIARRPPRCAPSLTVSEVPAGYRYLLESFTMTPAMVVGRHTQIIGWNQLAVAVFGDFSALPEHRRTLSHMLFTDPRVRDLYRACWAEAAHEQVAHLRFLAARHRSDAALAAHIDHMRALSKEFARIWAEHRVKKARSGTYLLHHPVAGEITLHRELVALPDEPSCCGLDLFAAEPGSASERALHSLASTEGSADAVWLPG